MINCTNHVLEQYAKRIKLIEKDLIKSTVIMNKDIYEKDLNKMYDNSKIIYKGTFSKKHNNSNFRMVDNIILITDKKDETLITLYRIDFGFGRNTDKIILEQLLKELKEGEEVYLQKRKEIEEETDSLMCDHTKLIMEIEAKKKEIKSLEESKNILEDYINIYKKDEIEAKETIDEIARKIVYSIDYRNSVKEVEN